MLTQLNIRDFAIVPSLDLEFETGFTAITGETGAGKSILVDALGLLLGDRSDSNWVRPGADKAELNACFSLVRNQPALQWLEEADLAGGNECLLRRNISANGRSRAWINGTPVTQAQLSQLGNLLVEIHGQNEHVQLTGRRQQLQLLDTSGDYADAVESTAEAYREWKDADERFQAAMNASGLDARELEFTRFQHAELEQHAIDAETLAELENEHRRLSRGGEMLDSLRQSLAQLDADDFGAVSNLHQAAHRLEGFSELDRNIDEARRMLEEAAINCQEAAGNLSRALERIDLSPERLQSVSQQLTELGDLSRKHRVPMEELCQLRDRLAEKLHNAENFEQQREALQAQCDTALKAYRERAARLSECRHVHGDALSEQVSSLMGELGMQGGKFCIKLRHDPNANPSVRGNDEIELLVSANPGIPPGPLAKIASGGELSRISLAIKVASSSAGERTQVFDEVDAGVGGDTANAVGRLLQGLAANGQALCVTHLAQVAACADWQLRVRKDASENATSVGSDLLATEQRVDEIARMLSGRVSDQSRAHAAELLDAARR